MQGRSFAETARDLARNPLGIIALFIVLIYGLASLVVGFSGKLQTSERLPVIWFLVVFPVLVLAVFAWLVSRHHARLYSPTDYREDASFIEATIQQAEVAAALGAATARKLNPASIGGSILDTRAVAGRVAKLMTRATLQSVRARKLLWVDDYPDDDWFEREALQALGFIIVLARSTDEALAILESEPFDAIISDMVRAPDYQAGFTFLSRLKSRGISIPYIIYSPSGAPDQQAKDRRPGTLAITARPDDLVAFVLEAVASPTVSESALSPAASPSRSKASVRPSGATTLRVLHGSSSD